MKGDTGCENQDPGALALLKTGGCNMNCLITVFTITHQLGIRELKKTLVLCHTLMLGSPCTRNLLQTSGCDISQPENLEVTKH